VIVLGVDPGTAQTGYGVVRGDGSHAPVLIECGVLRTKARDPLPVRLREIYEGIAELLDRHHPDALAVEDVFYARNVRTTIVLGHARGVVLLAGQQRGTVSFRRDDQGLHLTGYAVSSNATGMIHKIWRPLARKCDAQPMSRT